MSSHEAFLAVVPKQTVEISQDAVSFSLFRDCGRRKEKHVLGS